MIFKNQISTIIIKIKYINLLKIELIFKNIAI